MDIELLKQAILENGGLETDIEFITPEMIQALGKQLATKGIKSRTPNPSYSVRPINTVESIKESFDSMHDWIIPNNFRLEPVVDESKIIEFIQVTSELSVKGTLKEINRLGFDPAPFNYLFGLAVQYPDAHKEYKCVISFGCKSGDPDFLCLEGKSFFYISRGCFNETFKWPGVYWCAVIRKQPLKS